ncbi:hypothetical protein ACXHXG_05525 [Rhizobium sp. LEGMi198b]|uniref:hypothetical protein n=1 Tax=unclassified Rhizobium TaxID=2613769 RepID=UPI000CDF393E|nr:MULTISPECIES: hypothetical protein [Rhizobium]AVA20058.1 hypothetical protein NXC24_CH00384 [Rhizobium sp. NXC24]MDK4740817.1 hypothetical protein [Rhizobium sp. CNPSo 3464]UWU21365.1 hypothetical protein N2601_19385 [Rhizobium tropici]WFU02168.1 hypothetical protein QA648_19105 [Rhizobium sp. CB3171]
MRLVVSLSLLLSAVLAGCQSIDGGDNLEKGAPYQLSAKEIAAVEKGLHEQLPYEGVLIFGPMAASKDSKGYVSVCGTISSFGGLHGVMDKRPYVGMMVDVKPLFGFVPTVIADDSSTGPSAVILTCRRMGIAI